MLARAKRASHIDPPPSSYAIMRRACPYRGENPGPGKDVHGELDHRPGIREQPGSIATDAYAAGVASGPKWPKSGLRGPSKNGHALAHPHAKPVRPNAVSLANTDKLKKALVRTVR
jgi:hypothetical protein